MKTCQIQSCSGSVKAKGLCNKHYHKLRKYGCATVGYEEQSAKGEGSKRPGRYHRMNVGGKEKLAHVLIVEAAIGKTLPKGANVHHIDGNQQNNSHNNLIVCPSMSYHKLIHQRQASIEATGHADWRTCNRCHRYDAPENLYISANHWTVYHRSCEAEYQRARRSDTQPNHG